MYRVDYDDFKAEPLSLIVTGELGLESIRKKQETGGCTHSLAQLWARCSKNAALMRSLAMPLEYSGRILGLVDFLGCSLTL